MNERPITIWSELWRGQRAFYFYCDVQDCGYESGPNFTITEAFDGIEKHLRNDPQHRIERALDELGLWSSCPAPPVENIDDFEPSDAFDFGYETAQNDLSSLAAILRGEQA